MYEQIGYNNKMNMSVDWSANLLRPIVQKLGTACTCEVGKNWPKINCPIISPNNANTQKSDILLDFRPGCRTEYKCEQKEKYPSSFADVWQP